MDRGVRTEPLTLIDLIRQHPDNPSDARLEGFNPTGSIKDRTALELVEQAEREGALRAGMTVVEPRAATPGSASRWFVA